MTNRPRLTEKTYQFVKQQDRWFPIVYDRNDVPFIDMRSDGFQTKKAVLEWKKDRELYCGEIAKVVFK